MDYDYHASGGGLEGSIACATIDALAALIGRAFDLMLGDRLRLGLNPEVSPAHGAGYVCIGGRLH